MPGLTVTHTSTRVPLTIVVGALILPYNNEADLEVSINPYEPFHDILTERATAFVFVGDLSKASRYLSRMGALAIAYFCTTWILTVVACLNDDQLHPFVKLLLISVPTAMIPLTFSLTRAALSLTIDPVRYTGSARWLAILLGTFFFPFLTWPAYVAIRNMTQYARSNQD